MIAPWCRVVLQIDKHAANRLQQRYRMDLTDGLKARIFEHIESARAVGGRHPHACQLPQVEPRERWLVSTGGAVFHIVIEPPRIVTFLPLETHG